MKQQYRPCGRHSATAAKIAAVAEWPKLTVTFKFARECPNATRNGPESCVPESSFDKCSLNKCLDITELRELGEFARSTKCGILRVHINEIYGGCTEAVAVEALRRCKAEAKSYLLEKDLRDYTKRWERNTNKYAKDAGKK